MARTSNSVEFVSTREGMVVTWRFTGPGANRSARARMVVPHLPDGKANWDVIGRVVTEMQNAHGSGIGRAGRETPRKE